MPRTRSNLSADRDHARPDVGAEDRAELARLDTLVRTAVGIDAARGDRIRLEQVVINLLSNASKYSPQGATITVRVARRGAECIISVRDSGPGLAPDRLTGPGDLAATTDVRDVLGELVAARAGDAVASAVFPGHRAHPLGLFRN